METHNRQPPPAIQSSDSAEGGGGVALSLSDVEAVLKRAVQLDARDRVSTSSTLTVEDLTRIALESGISPTALQEALREQALGRLTNDRRGGLFERLFTPSASAARVAPMSEAAAKSELHRVLREEFLEVVERQGPRTLWEPIGGARAGVMRIIRKVWTGREDLRGTQVFAEVRPADSSGQRCFIVLEARPKRAGYTAPPLILGAFTTVSVLFLGGFGLAELAHQGASAAPLLIAAGSTAATGGAMSAGLGAILVNAWRQRLRRVRHYLEQLLDPLSGEEHDTTHL